MKIDKGLFINEQDDIKAWYISIGTWNYLHKDGVIRDGTGSNGTSGDIANYAGWYTTIDAARQAIINFYFYGVE